MIACDLGSNTLRIVELECQTAKRIREFERMVKTADGLHATGVISAQAVTRIIQALHDAAKIFDFNQKEYVAVTTAAMRMAANREEVLAKIAKETGVHFIMIDAKEEASLTHLAVSWRLKQLGYHDSFMLMDLGGASTEITIEEESKSFEIGIVTMAQKYQTAKGVEKNLKKELFPIQRYLQECYQRGGKPKLFVATAGTPTTIAAFREGLDYAHYDADKVNGTVLTLDDLDEALASLLSMASSERERWVGVGRDALIIAGVLIVKSIMIEAGFTKMLVIDDGLREGVALQKCQEKTSSKMIFSAS